MGRDGFYLQPILQALGVLLQDDMFWNEDKSASWEDTDMGTWVDETQENNSTWSSASGWNRGKKNIIKVKIRLRTRSVACLSMFLVVCSVIATC